MGEGCDPLHFPWKQKFECLFIDKHYDIINNQKGGILTTWTIPISLPLPYPQIYPSLPLHLTLSRFSEGYGSIWLGVSCSSRNTQLADCRRVYPRYCSHSDDVALKCNRSCMQHNLSVLSPKLSK